MLSTYGVISVLLLCVTATADQENLNLLSAPNSLKMNFKDITKQGSGTFWATMGIATQRKTTGALTMVLKNESTEMTPSLFDLSATAR